MIVNIVTVTVKPEMREVFEEVTRYNHENSRREPGNVRFDVLNSASDPNKYILYEVFKDEAAVEYHKTTEHYKRWAAEMERCMAAPRTKESFTVVALD
ncbi:MAG TPA: antibiotic biosynthesis monooxygenase [Bacillota bacterium]|nr:antibiotic biosynthesis monooxygenase [Clostridiales bacterium]HPT84680.1 antibiotic biosynthesis monooxygenase [Bacillota bacterium]